ncbi:MAG: hypothetical protein ABSE90_07230 [Verrucomicrobiota bacterium]|jgi:hypothetical protein
MAEMPITVGLGVSQSVAQAANSGGPFTNNAEIVFGNGIFGQTSQNEAQTATPTSTASADPFAHNANPNTGETGTLSGGSSMSTFLIYGAIAAAALAAIWLLNR